MNNCPFNIQQYYILHSYHNDHVVIICPYFMFDIEDINTVTFLSNVQKRNQVPSEIRKINNNMEKKIQESENLILTMTITKGLRL
jgi:hypothetical protein